MHFEIFSLNSNYKNGVTLKLCNQIKSESDYSQLGTEIGLPSPLRVHRSRCMVYVVRICVKK